MFVNLTNHPSENWSEEQLAAAQQYGDIMDICFPIIEPELTTSMVYELADATIDTILALGKDVVVHVMGEMTFTYAVVSRLKSLGIKCLASTTERNTVITPDGKKLSEFKFVQFREY